MATHFTEIDANSLTVRTILADPGWAESVYGGTWIQDCNRNPSENDPAASDPAFDGRLYGGGNGGHLCSFALVEVFVPTPEEWDPLAEFIDSPDPETNRWKWQRLAESDQRFCTYQGSLYRLAAPVNDVATSADVPGVSSRWQLHETDPVSGWGRWAQPGSWNPYPINFVVEHNGSYWKSNVPNNVWEPGATGITQWDEVDVNGDPLPPSAEWQAGVAYATNDEVTYQGTLYRCISGHTSQVGWEPPNVPALWTEV